MPVLWLHGFIDTTRATTSGNMVLLIPTECPFSGKMVLLIPPGRPFLVTWFYWYHRGARFQITWFHWYQPGARFLVTCFHTSLVPVLLSHGFINTSSNKATVYQRVTSVYQTVTSSTNAAVYQTVTSTYQTAIQCFLLYPIQTFICVWTPSLTKWVTKSYGPCLRNPSVIALNITRSLN